MNSLFRIGIIGCGKIARRHVEACLQSSAVDIAALVDPSLERAELLAHEFGVKTKIADSLDKVINHLDGVIIAAPNNFHCRLAIQCAKARVHVLIEKPIAGTSVEAKEICVSRQQLSDAPVNPVRLFWNDFRIRVPVWFTRWVGTLFCLQFEQASNGWRRVGRDWLPFSR